MPRGLRFSTAVHRTFSNNFRTRKNPISQARKRPGSYPILPPPRAIPNPIPTTPKPDLPVKNGDPGLKTGYFFTLLAAATDALSQQMAQKRTTPCSRSVAFCDRARAVCRALRPKNSRPRACGAWWSYRSPAQKPALEWHRSRCLHQRAWAPRHGTTQQRRSGNAQEGALALP